MIVAMLAAPGTGRAAPWVSTGGPIGGLGYDVRIHPLDKQTMFVTDNYAGVIKSTDGGKSWRPSNSGITVRGGPTGDSYTIFSLTIDPNDPRIVWAGTNGGNGAFGIFRSADGGESWSLRNTGITDGGFGIVFRGFTVQPGNSGVVYAQAELPTPVQGREFNRTLGRVYKSTNGGDSWSLLWSGDDLARHLIVDPSNPSILYLSTGIFDREASNSNCALGATGAGGVGVLKSTDGGTSWKPLNTGLGDLYVGALRMHPSDHQILFAATGNNACSRGPITGVTSGLYRTTNGAASWDKVVSDDILTTVTFSPSSPGVIYAGSARAFYRSADGGTTWRSFSKPSGGEWGPPGIRAGVPIDATVDPDDPNVLFANNYGGGVFASTDGARSWKVWSRGYSGAEVHALAVPETRPSTVYAIGRSGPFVSPNHGLDWLGIGNGDATFPEWNSVAVQPGSPDVVLISDEHQGWLLRSTNGGSDFKGVLHQGQSDASTATRRQGFKAIAFAPSTPSLVFAAMAKDRGTIDSSTPVGPVFFRSADGGLTFVSPGAGLDGKNVHRLVVDRTNAQVLWAATSGGVYKSVDAGTTWMLLGLAGQNVVAVAVNPSDAKAMIASVKNVGIFTSADGGASWPGGPYNAGVSNPNPAVLALIFEPTGGAIYAADFYSGVYRSTDGGHNWVGFPDAPMSGLSMRAVKDLVLGGSVLYAATQGGGVFRAGGPAVVPTPADGDFGSVLAGASSGARPFMLYNTGPATRALTARTIAGPDGADFQLRGDTCPAALAPRATCAFEIVFTPTAPGLRTAVLNVASDDPFGTVYPVALHGLGGQPPPDAAAPPDAAIDAPVATASPDAAAIEAPLDGGAADRPMPSGTPDADAPSRPPADAAATADAPVTQPGPGPTPKMPAKGGGGCTLGADSWPPGGWWLLVASGALVLGGRRRRR
jgi:hypothetical protein